MTTLCSSWRTSFMSRREMLPFPKSMQKSSILSIMAWTLSESSFFQLFYHNPCHYIEGKLDAECFAFAECFVVSQFLLPVFFGHFSPRFRAIRMNDRTINCTQLTKISINPCSAVILPPLLSAITDAFVRCVQLLRPCSLSRGNEKLLGQCQR